MSLLAQLDRHIHYYGGSIVFCQPVPGSLLDNSAIVAAVALAAEQAGAVVLRIEGLANLQAVRPLVTVPVVVLIKHNLHDNPVRITPWVENVNALAQAGADIIAVDDTRRQRPASVTSLLTAIHRQGEGTMADCSSLDDTLKCWQLGFDMVGTTLSGYTVGKTPDEPDLALVKSLGTTGCRVVAEGRYNTPTQVAEAMRCGAWTVTVRSTIARLEHICGWYNSALKAAVCPANEQ